MIAVLFLWVIAMVAGLRWPRWAVIGASGASVIGAVVVLARDAAWAAAPLAWAHAAAVGATPWLLLSQRERYEQRRRRLQAREAYQVTQRQEGRWALEQLEEATRTTEAAIGRMTDLYYVTKETSRALRREELFAVVLEILPKLLPAGGFSLIDAAPAAHTPPTAQRAWRSPEGRFDPEALEAALSGVEQAVLGRAVKQRRAGAGDGASFGMTLPNPAIGPRPPRPVESTGRGGLPMGLHQMTCLAWAPLWADRRPVGVLIAYGASQEQLETLTIIANQLSLQLSRVHLYERLETMAVTDALTGLSVRRYVMEHAAEELQRAKRHGLSLCVVMADLDLFKAKNDTYGHLVGDAVLRDVARLLRENLRDVDLAARYGGEEFLLVLVETGPSQAMPVAERLRQMVEVQPICAFDETLQQTVSMGLACFPEDAQELQELIDRADEALYAAKQAGRNRVVRWTPDIGAARPHPDAEHSATSV